MMGLLTSMVESQLHNLFAVAKTGTQCAINISASDKIVKREVLDGHIDGLGLVPGYEIWGETHDEEKNYRRLMM